MDYSLTDLTVIALCISSSLYIYLRHSSVSLPLSKQTIAGYVLENSVTHARLLPLEAKHAFTYSTVAVFVSVTALEQHSLDVGFGRVFGYGGRGLKIFGLRHQPYLAPNSGHTILDKLRHLIRSRGYDTFLQDAWMLTMPSFMGWEGINPLTVYFCYDTNKELWLVVLEVHNTFGESHVYLLNVGCHEDAETPPGFDHQWTFCREFHVSPFNDRTGHYQIAVRDPFSKSRKGNPLPAVRIHQHVQPESPNSLGPLKLTALFRPINSTPISASALLNTMARYPFALFTTFVKIAYQAWILHYVKRLDVFVRPPPLPAAGSTSHAPGGVKWLPESPLEAWARHRLSTFLSQRVREFPIKVSLVGPDPSVPPSSFSATEIENTDELTVAYFSPEFFTMLFSCPSAEHALLLGYRTERIFVPSSEELFRTVFDVESSSSKMPTVAQRMRMKALPSRLPVIPIKFCHFLDRDQWLVPCVVLSVLQTLDTLEEALFWLFRARIVKGREPWRRWNRVLASLQMEPAVRADTTYGSVLRP